MRREIRKRASTPVDLMPTQQQIASARAIRARLISRGQESSTEYGRALFATHGQALADALDALMTRFVVDPAIAGPHYEALPLLLHFATVGVRPVASVALTKVLDGISARHRHRKLAMAIGRAIEDEVRAGRIKHHDRDTLRLLLRHEGKRTVLAPSTLRSLRLPADRWTQHDRVSVGSLLLRLIVSETDLVQIVSQAVRGAMVLMVEATPATLELVRSMPLDIRPERGRPQLTPPEPRDGYAGLVRRRDGAPTDYMQQAGPAALAAVQRLEAQPVTVDPWMADVQQQAWAANIRGLFSVTRDPAQAPPRPHDATDHKAMANWRRQERAAWADGREHGRARERIDEAIREAQCLAGQSIWFRYDLDFRGRVYTANRTTTHQGPDHEKALLWLPPEPCDEEAADWMLRACAGHWGLSRASWDERLRWGRDNIDRLVAVADAPLDQVELWRDAADPWQFLQMARAFRLWLGDPATPIGAPVRLDQTTSGLGIAAALVRDERLARETNLIGSTRHDIYQRVADELVAALQRELEAGLPSHQRHAAQWLEIGITRSLCKEPVMAAIYGGQFQSLFDGLADHLRNASLPKRASEYERSVVIPARFLAKLMKETLQPELAPLLALKDWLKGASAAVVKQQQQLRWTSPSGFPVVLGGKRRAHAPAHTLLHGSRGWETPDSDERRRELSVLATNRSITANLVHSFDAALVHAVICRAEAVSAHVLTNHDCFAVTPARARWLHQTLLGELRSLYMPDWLDEIRAEITAHSGIPGLPAPPMVGTLNPARIGQNPYVFS